MVRNAALRSGLDDKSSAKLMALVNPMVDQEGATDMQVRYLMILLIWKSIFLYVAGV